jgi:hypothetical protein
MDCRVRRGYEVYKQVCQACHSMQYVYFRHFVNVFMTEAEAKEEALNALVKDTDDTGKPIERPGLLTDKLPAPYPNAKAAGAANNGAVPPDLSLMSLARHGGDVCFPLLRNPSFEIFYFPGLHLLAPHQLLRSSCWRQGRRRQGLQPVLPRRRHLHATATVRRGHRIQRR